MSIAMMLSLIIIPFSTGWLDGLIPEVDDLGHGLFDVLQELAEDGEDAWRSVIVRGTLFAAICDVILFLASGCYVINVETGRSYSAGAFMTKYYDGYCFYLANRFGKIIRMDKNGNTIEFTNEGKIPWGEPSNGLIYINKKFYDIKTADVKIDLSEYDMVSEGSQKFNDNKQFTFTFRNPAGTRYSATIDINGDFINEPQKIG